MLKIELRHMADVVSEMGPGRITFVDIANKTGISAQTLSRIANDPVTPTSSDLIEKLVIYFFNRIRANLPFAWDDDEAWPRYRFWSELNRSPEEINSDTMFDRKLMRWVVSELIQIYPDDAHFTKELEGAIVGSPYTVNTSILWSLYEKRSVTKQRAEVIHAPTGMDGAPSSRQPLTREEKGRAANRSKKSAVVKRKN